MLLGNKEYQLVKHERQLRNACPRIRKEAYISVHDDVVLPLLPVLTRSLRSAAHPGRLLDHMLAFKNFWQSAHTMHT